MLMVLRDRLRRVGRLCMIRVNGSGSRSKRMARCFHSRVKITLFSIGWYLVVRHV